MEYLGLAPKKSLALSKTSRWQPKTFKAHEKKQTHLIAPFQCGSTGCKFSALVCAQARSRPASSSIATLAPSLVVHYSESVSSTYIK
jgi:hypothetical protein